MPKNVNGASCKHLVDFVHSVLDLTCHRRYFLHYNYIGALFSVTKPFQFAPTECTVESRGESKVMTMLLMIAEFNSFSRLSGIDVDREI